MNLPAPTRPIHNKTFSLRITNDLTEEIDRIAARNHWTRAALLRHFIVKCVRELRDPNESVSPA